MSDNRAREHGVKPSSGSSSRGVVATSSSSRQESYQSSGVGPSSARSRSSTAPSTRRTTASAQQGVSAFAPLPHPSETSGTSLAFAGQLPPGYRIEGPGPSTDPAPMTGMPRFDETAYRHGTDSANAPFRNQYEQIGQVEGGSSAAYVPPHRQRTSGYQAAQQPEELAGWDNRYGPAGGAAQPSQYSAPHMRPHGFQQQAPSFGGFAGGQPSYQPEHASQYPVYEYSQPTSQYSHMQPQQYAPPQSSSSQQQRVELPKEYSIFVGQLGAEVDEGMLWRCFGPVYQSFIKANLMRDRETGQSRGFAFVRFTNRAERDHALENMSGTYIGNSQMVVGKANKELYHGPEQELERAAGMTPGAAALGSYGHASAYGSQAGGGQPGYDPLYPSQGLSSGGAQGSFQEHLDANDPRRFPMGHITGPRGYPGMPGDPAVLPRPLHVDPNNITVFVGGLAYGSTPEDLREVFQEAGEIVHITIPEGKGCGFVKMASHEQALFAITSLQGRMLRGSRLRLSWGKHAR